MRVFERMSPSQVEAQTPRTVQAAWALVNPALCAPWCRCGGLATTGPQEGPSSEATASQDEKPWVGGPALA